MGLSHWVADAPITARYRMLAGKPLWTGSNTKQVSVLLVCLFVFCLFFFVFFLFCFFVVVIF